MIQDPSLRAWLKTFATCVRNRDLDAGKTLFAPDIHAFGTRAEVVHDLKRLVAQQWQPIWFNTRDFRFLSRSLVALPDGDRSQVCVLGLWVSQGISAEGKPFIRRGRCTILLRKDEAMPHGYAAVHTHFSKTPDGAL